MKHALRVVLVFAVWLAASISIAHFWVTNADAFPSLPPWLWSWADSHYQSGNAEEVADLQFLVAFSISGVSQLLVCLLGYVIWRKIRSMR